MKKWFAVSSFIVTISSSAFASQLHCVASSDNDIRVRLSEKEARLTLLDYSKEEVFATESKGKVHFTFKQPDGSARYVAMRGNTFEYLWRQDWKDESAGGLARNQYIVCKKLK